MLNDRLGALIRAKDLVKLILQILGRLGPSVKLVEAPLQKDTRRVVASKEETAEGVAGLLEDLGGQNVDALETEGGNTAGCSVSAGQELLMLLLNLFLKDAVEFLVQTSESAFVLGEVFTHPILAGYTLVEGLRQGAVCQQHLALFAFDLSVQIHVESDDALCHP